MKEPQGKVPSVKYFVPPEGSWKVPMEYEVVRRARCWLAQASRLKRRVMYSYSQVRVAMPYLGHAPAQLPVAITHTGTLCKIVL